MTTEPTPKPVTDLLDSLDLWREITVERRRAAEALATAGKAMQEHLRIMG